MKVIARHCKHPSRSAGIADRLKRVANVDPGTPERVWRSNNVAIIAFGSRDTKPSPHDAESKHGRDFTIISLKGSNLTSCSPSIKFFASAKVLGNAVVDVTGQAVVVRDASSRATKR